ncbi:hypothetical protein [uncultured Mucilaginibacter sp.]|uniref:hypothetical protein n=1 Tax=uncultured Mucilaginibacter sp. TaxID=797541 RepID=UPI0025CC0182|nr:hypothetical protein [uncultured Mucilaginibacter sp.]
MKLKQLFDELKKATDGKEATFEESGIVNCFSKMQYGFFPVGNGILTEDLKNGRVDTSCLEIGKNGIMVLGNDFGTLTYVKKYSDRVGETDSITINNLCKNTDLDCNKTFFTNFYLGVRDDETHGSAKMTFRAVALKKDYKALCLDFFITQLDLVKPKAIICLGQDVKNALLSSMDSFTQWGSKSTSLKKLYESNKYIIKNEVGKQTYIVIPHPCDLRNFKGDYITKLNQLLNSIQ